MEELGRHLQPVRHDNFRVANEVFQQMPFLLAGSRGTSLQSRSVTDLPSCCFAQGQEILELLVSILGAAGCCGVRE